MSILPSLVLLLAIVGARVGGGGPAAASRSSSPASSRRRRPGSSSTGRWGWNAVGDVGPRRPRGAWRALRAARTSPRVRVGRRRGSAPRPLALGLRRGLGAPRRCRPSSSRRRLASRRRAEEARRRCLASPPRASRRALVVDGAARAPLRGPPGARARPDARALRRAGRGRAAPSALSRNAVAYARLFAVGGDPNERHGDPARPVLPVAVTGLALLAVAADGLRRPGAARLLAAVAGAPSRREPPRRRGVGERLPDRLSPRPSSSSSRPSARSASSTSSARLAGRSRRPRSPSSSPPPPSSTPPGFLRWLSSPRLYGAFGGPERDLADAVAAELVGRRPGRRPPRPGGGPQRLRRRRPPPGPAERRRRRSGRGRASPRSATSPPATSSSRTRRRRNARPTPRGPRGGRRSPSGGVLPGQPGWTLWRVPAGRAAERARAFLEGFPRVPARGAGSLARPRGGALHLREPRRRRRAARRRRRLRRVPPGWRPHGAPGGGTARPDGAPRAGARSCASPAPTGSSSRRPDPAPSPIPRARGGASRGRGAALRGGRRAPSRGRRRAAPAAPARRRSRASARRQTASSLPWMKTVPGGRRASRPTEAVPLLEGRDGRGDVLLPVVAAEGVDEETPRRERACGGRGGRRAGGPPPGLRASGFAGAPSPPPGRAS